MSTTIQSLLNPSIGIQSLLEMPGTEKLPEARELANAVLRETGLENLYGTVNTRSSFESLLLPKVGDGTMLAPEVFDSLLGDIVRKLSVSENPQVKTMVEQELKPLLENGVLLSAYRGLMIGG